MTIPMQSPPFAETPAEQTLRRIRRDRAALKARGPQRVLRMRTARADIEPQRTGCDSIVAHDRRQAGSEVPAPAAGSFANPFLVWSALAMRAGETLWASAQVIGLRGGRMASAGLVPNQRDRHEFQRMGDEKYEAAQESSQAMAAQVLDMQSSFWSQSFGQLRTGALAMIALAGSSSLPETMARQVKLFDALTDAAATASQLSVSGARLAHSALAPIHARVMANALRLTELPDPSRA